MAHVRKLIVYADEETLNREAGNYPCLVNYQHGKRHGEFDDGVGNTASIEFTTRGQVIEHAGKDFDAIEFVGMGAVDLAPFMEA